MNSTTLDKMEALQKHMFDVAVEMEYYAGFDVVADHAKELLGASAVLQTWIDGIKKEQGK